MTSKQRNTNKLKHNQCVKGKETRGEEMEVHLTEAPSFSVVSVIIDELVSFLFFFFVVSPPLTMGAW